MPSFESFKSKYKHLPPTQRTSIAYRYYNAITSEAYLLQTQGNLVTDIFNLFKQLKQAKQEKKGMNDEFSILTENLELVSRNVLDLTRTDTEVRYLLTGDTAHPSTKCIPCYKCSTIPPVIRDALQLKVKGVNHISYCYCKIRFNSSIPRRGLHVAEDVESVFDM